MTLTEFLTARLDEDELVARSCAVERWTVKDGWHNGLDMEVLSSTYPACIEPEEATHTARHDPARVLAEAEAKRRIVDWFSERRMIYTPTAMHDDPTDPALYVPGPPVHEADAPVLRMLALPYADHPDYQEEWRA